MAENGDHNYKEESEIRKLINDLLGISESYEMPTKLMTILADKKNREELFNKFLEEKKDLSYDWFTDYYQEEQGDRNALKQDFTPDCICEIVNKVNEKADKIADICSGTGGLTIKLWNENRDAFFHCEEVAARAVPVLLFNLAIRNIRGEVIHGDVLTRKIEKVYRLTPSVQYSDIEVTNVPTEQKYESVVMNPPYSLKWSGETDERFEEFGVPPKSKADYCFILHGLNMLEDNGRLLAILPHGVLFRGSGEGKIREKLIEKNMIRSVIGLPDNLFLNTGIPVLLLELRRHSGDLLVIDGSKEFKKDKPNNKMTDENINTIVTAYKMRRKIDKLANVVDKKEIAENGYNLNIPRYVDTFEPEEVPDLVECLKELKEINRDIEKSEKELLKMLEQLTGTTPKEMKEQEEINKIYENYIESKYGQMEIKL